MCVMGISLQEPPFPDRLNRKARRIEAINDTNESGILRDVIEAVGNGMTNRILRPVMNEYRIGFLTPLLTGILEVTDYLFFSYPH